MITSREIVLIPFERGNFFYRYAGLWAYNEKLSGAATAASKEEQSDD